MLDQRLLGLPRTRRPTDHHAELQRAAPDTAHRSKDSIWPTPVRSIPKTAAPTTVSASATASQQWSWKTTNQGHRGYQSTNRPSRLKTFNFTIQRPLRLRHPSIVAVVPSADR